MKLVFKEKYQFDAIDGNIGRDGYRNCKFQEISDIVKV